MMNLSIVLALGVILGFALSVVVDYIDGLNKAKKEKRERLLTFDDLNELYKDNEGPDPQRHADEPPEINNLPWSFGGARVVKYDPTPQPQPAKEETEYDYARERELDRERDRANEEYYRSRQEEDTKRGNALEIIRLGRAHVPYEIYDAAEKVILNHLTPKPNIQEVAGLLPRRKGLKGLEIDKPFDLDEFVKKQDEKQTIKYSEEGRTLYGSTEQAETATLHEPNKPE